MKKKMMASLLAGSTVVDVSLAPLSTQATTTGNTPATTTFEGGTLPDDNDDANTVDPDPSGSSSNFDLLFIPRESSFGKLSISDDLTKPVLNQRNPEATNGHTEMIGAGDVRGGKEDWHLTVQSNGLKLGTESLQGNIKVALITQLDLEYEAIGDSYVALATTVPTPEVRPRLAAPRNWTLDLGGEVRLVANAAAGQSQGLWQFSLFNTALNIITPANNVKVGAYTGGITWNLIAEPSAQVQAKKSSP